MKIPGLPSRSSLPDPIRDVLEEIKRSIGRAPLQGTDTRTVKAIQEARPDLRSLEVNDVAAVVRVTLDKIMHDIVSQAKVDPQHMEYEFQIIYSGKQIVVTGDAGYRAIADRPKNKKKFEAALKREIALALTVLFETRHVPRPDEFINKVTDSLGRELTRVYLDARITEDTIHTLKTDKKPKK